MNFKEWVEALPGRATSVAKRFKVSKPAITHWKKNGVPVAYMIEVAKLSEGEVTVEELVNARAPVEVAKVAAE